VSSGSAAVLLPEVDGYELDELLPLAEVPAPDPIVSEALPVRSDGDVVVLGTPVEVAPGLVVPGELMAPGEPIVPCDVPEREVSEPAPAPMLPADEPGEDEDDGDVSERVLSDFEPDLLTHSVNSDWEMNPSLFLSAESNLPLSSLCIAASVCEMRPSLFASSVENTAVPALPWLAPLEPMVLLLELLLWPDMPGLVVVLDGFDVLCP